MESGLGFLFAAFSVVWLALLLYLLNLSGRLNALQREVDALKRDEAKPSGELGEP